MAVFKRLNFCSLWSIIVTFLLLSVDECQGQSSSGGVNIVAVIISVIVIVCLICLSMPICIICLVVALICTCTKYKKAKKDRKTLVTENSLPQTSVHHLPLPPIPIATDHGVEEGPAEYEFSISELKVEANRAYGTNLTNDGINQVVYYNHDLTVPNRAHDHEVNTVTEVDQEYELDDIIDDSDLKTEENRAYGSKLSAEPNNNEVMSTDKNIAYEQCNQLAEEGDTYEYI